MHAEASCPDCIHLFSSQHSLPLSSSSSASSLPFFSFAFCFGNSLNKAYRRTVPTVIPPPPFYCVRRTSPKNAWSPISSRKTRFFIIILFVSHLNISYFSDVSKQLLHFFSCYYYYLIHSATYSLYCCLHSSLISSSQTEKRTFFYCLY